MATWTIIMQISGENNLLLDSISAYNEIAGTGSTNEINFVVLMDRMQVIGELPEKYKEYSYLADKELAYPSVYLVKKGETYDKAKPVEVFKDDNLNDKENLTRILKHIIDQDKFKADNYGFIYKGHGAAGATDVDSKSFISKVFKVKKEEYDENGNILGEKLIARLKDEKIETSNEYTFSEEYFLIDDEEQFPGVVLAIFTKGDLNVCLRYTDLESALSSTFGKNGLEFLLLDCCWGMVLENVHQFKDVTKHFIASEDEMPALGIGYKNFTEFITQKSALKSYELAKMMVAVYYTRRFDDYNDPSDPKYKNMGISLTCVDTKTYKNLVLNPFIKLVSKMINGMHLYARDIFTSLSKCKDFTYSRSPYEYGMFNLDLIWFFENLAYYTKDEKLKTSIYEVIMNVRLYLMKGYMENNYKETILGGSGQFHGGKGIGITLPKKPDYYSASTIGNAEFDIPFFKDTNWRKLVLRFYEYYYKTDKLLAAAFDNIENPALVSLIEGSPMESGTFSKQLNDVVAALKSNNKSDHSLEDGIKKLQPYIDKIDEKKFYSVFTKDFTKSLHPVNVIAADFNLNIKEKWKKL